MNTSLQIILWSVVSSCCYGAMVDFSVQRSFFESVRAGDLRKVQALAAAVSIEVQDGSGSTALHYAATEKRSAMVESGFLHKVPRLRLRIRLGRPRFIKRCVSMEFKINERLNES